MNHSPFSHELLKRIVCQSALPLTLLNCCQKKVTGVLANSSPCVTLSRWHIFVVSGICRLQILRWYEERYWIWLYLFGNSNSQLLIKVLRTWFFSPYRMCIKYKGRQQLRSGLLCAGICQPVLWKANDNRICTQSATPIQNNYQSRDPSGILFDSTNFSLR